MTHFQPAPSPAPQWGEAPEIHVPERIGLGLVAASLAVVAGAVLTVVLWRAGFIASITTFLLAAGASYLYTRAAGTPPRKGLVPLVLLIVLGVAVCFFAVVGSDLSDIYDRMAGPGAIPKTQFIRENLFDGDVLGSYGKDGAMFALFAALGLFSTLRRLLSAR
jgi:hypothetical protein